jgi:hypothetical protein
MTNEPSALARALLVKTMAAFQVVPDQARGPALSALDRFLAAPAPATFLAASRVLGQTRRAIMLERSAGGTMRRAFDEGLAALRAVPALPSALADRLASLPVDPRAGQRLFALAALTDAYQELATRVAADSEEMRRRLRAAAPRRGTARR